MHPFGPNKPALPPPLLGWAGVYLHQTLSFKNPFSCLKKCSANKRQSTCAAVQIAKPPLPKLSDSFVLYLSATHFQHCFPTQTSVTPMYFGNRLIKTAHLLYFDCPISSLHLISELQLEVLFDLSHPANPRDICEHSWVRNQGKDQVINMSPQV